MYFQVILKVLRQISQPGLKTLSITDNNHVF